MITSMSNWYYGTPQDTDSNPLPKLVLSVDGGGARGLGTLIILKKIEEIAGPTFKWCDLIVGSSVGGMIAAALSTGIPAKEIESMLYEHIPKVFSQTFEQKVKADTLWWPKYTPDNLEKLLKKQFGDKHIADALTEFRLLGLVEEPKTACIYFTRQAAREAELGIKDDEKPWFPNLDGEKINPTWASLLRAITAAQTYFPAGKLEIDGSKLTISDGGFYCNNPCMDAYVYAEHLWGRGSDMLLTSVGTGFWDPAIPKDCADGGDLEWAPVVLSTAWLANSLNATNNCQLALKDDFCRLNPEMDTNKYKLDANTPEELRAIEKAANEYVAANIKEITAWALRLKAIAEKKEKLVMAKAS